MNERTLHTVPRSGAGPTDPAAARRRIHGHRSHAAGRRHRLRRDQRGHRPARRLDRPPGARPLSHAEAGRRSILRLRRRSPFLEAIPVSFENSHIRRRPNRGRRLRTGYPQGGPAEIRLSRCPGLRAGRHRHPGPDHCLRNPRRLLPSRPPAALHRRGQLSRAGRNLLLCVDGNRASLHQAFRPLSDGAERRLRPRDRQRSRRRTAANAWTLREATPTERRLFRLLIDRANEHMGRRIDTDGLPELLVNGVESPRWKEIAERCLVCGNCTMVCPTCFCYNVYDHTDLTGNHAERRRRWGSCFALEFTYMGGQNVRTSGSSRYRQWMTHKLSSWHEQFGTSGCVGCGRCITWCPVGIDITEEAAAFRQAAATEPGAPAAAR